MNTMRQASIFEGSRRLQMTESIELLPVVYQNGAVQPLLFGDLA